VQPASVAEARQAVRRGLEDAVAHALRGARRAAVLAGGGLDSAALLALARRWAETHGATVFAVALDFGGVGDDRPHLAALERHLGCEVIRVRPEDGARHARLVRDGVDAAPFTWPAGPMEVELFARARAHGAELVLSGVGADELFDGSPADLACMARQTPLAALHAARAMRGFAAPRSPVWSWIARPLLARGVPAAFQAWRARRAAMSGVPRWAGPVLKDVMSRDVDAGDTWELPHHEHLAWLEHQEEVASGIACRQPFLEPALRALVRSIEPAWLLDGNIRRGLFREAVRDLLPRGVVERADKASFEQAHRAFFAASERVLGFRELASMDELAALGVVERRPFADAFAAFERGTDEGDGFTTLWPVLAVESFVRSRKSVRS
jgi:asparagine synthase (glutamine-hydrolysing)